MTRNLWLVVCAALALFIACDALDTTDPDVAIVQPASNATLGPGNITIKAVATDDNAVDKVTFYAGATEIGEDGTGSNDTFDITWTAVEGAYTLKAVAADEAGNTAEHTINVTIQTGGGGTGPTYHEGEIDTNEVWWPSANPHVLTGNVYTGDNVTLTIKPGCVVQAEADVELYCGYANPGSIIAVGTPDSAITFTSRTDTVAGFWKGLSFYAQTISTARMSYCNVLFAGKTSDNQGAVVVEGFELSFDHNLVRKSGTCGVWLGSSASFADFTSNTITGCVKYPVHIASNYVGTLGAGNTLTGNTKSGIEVYSTQVNVDATWRNHGVPYIITDDIGIDGNATVTIEPGTTLALQGDVEFYCGYAGPGAIIAVGTAASPIKFTADGDTVAGIWDALSFYGQTTSQARLSYVIVECAGGQNELGAVVVDNCDIKMDNCTLRKNAQCGVWCVTDGHFTDFSSNTITTSGEYPIRIQPDWIRTLGTGNVLTGNAKDAIKVEQVNVRTTGTWLNHGVPYHISDDIAVGDDASPVLTIAAGNKLVLEPDVEFYVGYGAPGGLIADGTAGEIEFTSSVASPGPGDWARLSFYDMAMNNQCQLVNCRVEYGGGDNTGNIHVSDANPTITGCNIGHSSSWGIYLTGDPTNLPDPAELRANNTFYDNASGDVREP